jgi:hypothetical protein
MKATIDIPDQLYRQVKARAALEGRAVREVTIELYTDWLGEAPTRGPGGAPTTTPASQMDEWLRGWAELGERVQAATTNDGRLLSDTITVERR